MRNPTDAMKVAMTASPGATAMTRSARRSPGALLLSAAAAVAIVLPASLARADDVDYVTIVDLVKVDVIYDKGKSHKPRLEFTFNVHPRVPKGTKIEFELRYQYLPYESTYYVLKTDARKNLKLKWTPRKPLPVDTYQLRTKIPLNLQSARVKRELASRQKDFPPASEPWSMNYPKMPIEIGTAADRLAQERRIKKFFRENADNRILAYNNEFIDTLEKVKKGEKFVEGGTLDLKEFGAYVDAWIKKYGQMQLELAQFETKEPGLFRKNEAAHFHLQRLARLVAKRCWRELGEALGKYGHTVADLKLEGHQGFNRNERGRPTPRSLASAYMKVKELVKWDEEPGEGGGAAGKGKKGGKRGAAKRGKTGGKAGKTGGKSGKTGRTHKTAGRKTAA